MTTEALAVDEARAKFDWAMDVALGDYEEAVRNAARREPDEAEREAIIEKMAEAMREYARASTSMVFVMQDANELARAAYEAMHA